MKRLFSIALCSLLLAGSVSVITAQAGDKPSKAKSTAVADTTHTKHATAAKAAKGDKAANPVTAQCAAITKKGTQCTRKAVAGSKYCKQHANYKPKS